MGLLDTRDAELRLWRGDDVVRSPGFVLLDGSEYRFGEDALANARLRPRDVSNRFWWQLSTQPLKPALGSARHTADLVHAHLQALHREAGAPDGLVLAVPDSMPREQLSLLLGIVQACDFDALGLVSRSLLLATAAGATEHCLHVELQLHQGVINELGPVDGQLRLLRSTPLPACGLLQLQERCVSAIAQSFIQQTRFDPRRSAASEQALYNQLPSILATIVERGECSVDIDGNRARVVASSMSGVTERLGEALAKALDGKATTKIIVDSQLQLLAGVSPLPGELLLLPDNALWVAYQEHADDVHSAGDDFHLVDRLPLDGGTAPAPAPDVAERETGAAAPAQPASAAAPNGAIATHVLLGTRALPLRGERVELGGAYRLQRAGDHWTLHGDDALINGLPSTPNQPLALGDTLSLGSVGHGRLIEVVS